MRLRLTCNAGGDIRLQCLADKPHTRKVDTAGGALLVCSSEFQEMTTPRPKLPSVGFGKISTRTQFSKYARALIREIGARLDTGPLSNLVFLTGTLPGSSLEALAAISAWSGWITQSVKQFLRDSLETPRYFGVWEYQKRGALHLHVCVRTTSPVQAARLKQRWKQRWIKLLDSVGKRAQVDMYAREGGGTWADCKWITKTDAQTVERSVTRYLSKYLSKGSTSARKWCEYPPSRWWFASKQAQTEARLARKVIEVPRLHLGTAIELFEKLGSTLAELTGKCFSYMSPYNVQIKGLIALCGPVQAGMVWRYLADNLRPLHGAQGSTVQRIIPAVDWARIMFRCYTGLPDT